ncbi:MAG: hypothetical protein WBA76_01810 [Phormidesmis sp.]
MLDTTVKDFKSKATCPRCSERKLDTNDSEKIDIVIYHHCLSCGFEFSENEQQREYRKDKEKKDSSDSPWNAGIWLAIAMIATILTVGLSENNNANNVEPDQVRFELQQP